MRAAVANGADAVYFGLSQLQRPPPGDQLHARRAARGDGLPPRPQRARVRHLQHADLLRRTAGGDRGSSRAVAAAGVDAVIVQDLGLARLIGRLCPTLHVHGSTQMTLTEPRGHRVRQSARREARHPRPRTVGRRHRQDHRRHRRAGRNLRPRRPVRRLQRPVPDQRIARRPQRQPRPVRPGLPPAVRPDRRRRRAATWATKPICSARRTWPPTTSSPTWRSSACAASRSKAGSRAPTTSPRRRRRIAPRSTPCGRELGRSRSRRSSEQELAQSFSRGFTHGFLDGVESPGTGPRPLPQEPRACASGTVVGRDRADGRPIVELDRAAATLKPGDGVVFDEGHPEQDEQGGRVFASPSRLAGPSDTPALCNGAASHGNHLRPRRREPVGGVPSARSSGRPTTPPSAAGSNRSTPATTSPAACRCTCRVDATRRRAADDHRRRRRRPRGPVTWTGRWPWHRSLPLTLEPLPRAVRPARRYAVRARQHVKSSAASCRRSWCPRAC